MREVSGHESPPQTLSSNVTDFFSLLPCASVTHVVVLESRRETAYLSAKRAVHNIRTIGYEGEYIFSHRYDAAIQEHTPCDLYHLMKLVKNHSFPDMPQRQEFLKRRGAFLLALLLLAASSVAAIVLFHADRHSFLYFGDAASHIVKARAIFDGQHPGLWNLGTVWLPLPHLLLLPAVAIDALFFSGIAGAAVGIPCSVGTGVFLFFIVRRLTGSAPVAFLAACLFCFNPNVVYMSLTPMSEPELFFFVTLGGYALLRWQQDRSTRWLMASAAAVMLATLCRYEAWLLPPYLILLSISNGRGVRKQPWGHVARTAATVAFVSLAGIFLWLGWNFYRYGDALTFARWTYDVAPAVVHHDAERLPLQILLNFARAVLVVFGPGVILVAAGVFLPSRSGAVQKERLPVLLYFVLPALFILASIFADFVQIDQWRWNWRYVLTIGLFLALAAGSGLKEIFDRVHQAWGRGALIAAVLLMPLLQLTVPSIGVATFDDALRCYSDDPRAGAAVGEQLGVRYHGGAVALITGYGQAQRIMVSSGMALKEFDFLHNPAEGDPLGSITKEERFLIIGKDRTPESARYVDEWLERLDTLLRDHEVRSEDAHYILLERTSTPARSSHQAQDPARH